MNSAGMIQIETGDANRDTHRHDEGKVIEADHRMGQAGQEAPSRKVEGVRPPMT